jgi:hypothetical protein
MALGFKTTVANSMLNAALTASAYTGPAALYVKLHVGAPGAAGTTSPAGNTTRKVITFGAASGGVSTSTSDENWVSVSTSETYTHFTIWDDVSAGNFMGSGTLTANPVTAGDTFDLAIGACTVTLLVAS